MVKLLSKWVLDDKYESIYRKETPPAHHISNGVWETSGVEEKDGQRNYTLTCIWSFSPKVPVGTEIVMREDVLVELCHMIEIVHLEKLPSMIKRIS